MASISGHVGGTGASGATVQIRSTSGDELKLVNADSSGDYTATVNGAISPGKKYIVTASLANKVYRSQAEVLVIDQNVGAVNLALNALNDPSTYV
jgi:hypothetical protein